MKARGHLQNVDTSQLSCDEHIFLESYLDLLLLLVSSRHDLVVLDSLSGELADSPGQEMACLVPGNYREVGGGAVST